MGGKQATKKAQQPETVVDAGAEGPAEERLERETVVDEVLKAVIKVPIGEVPKGVHFPTHVEVQLSPRRARAMKRIFQGIRGEPLEARGVVTSHNHVLLWVLDRVAELTEPLPGQG